ATTELERARSLRDEADEARAAGPDAAAVNAVLAAIEQVDPLRRDVEALRPQVDRALEEADRAQVAADEAAAELADADQRLAAAKDVARLGAVIAGLVVGEACPVCRQTVHELPEHDLDAELAAATGAQKASARRAREAAEEARRLSIRATEASARLGAVQEHLARIESQVPHDADVAVLRAELERAALLAQEQQKAHEAVKAAERAETRARKELQALEKHEVRLRRDLHAVRDALAARIPPALDGESLAQDWERLVEWAQQERSSVEADRDGAAQDAASLG